MEQLLQSIHLDYGFYLHRIGADSIAGLYWKKSGQAGQAMIETLANVTPVPKRYLQTPLQAISLDKT